MQTTIEGKNIDLTDAIREYVESKLARVHNHFDSIIQNQGVRVVLSVLKHKKRGAKVQKAEITINLKGGHVVRCEDSESTIYASIDMVIDKLEKQLRKHKTRVYHRAHHGNSAKGLGLGDLANVAVPKDLMEQVQAYTKPNIIKTKRFKMEPLEPDVALEKLEDSGHPFYMFLNVFSNKIACVYRREDGDYGLIEPEFLEVKS